MEIFKKKYYEFFVNIKKLWDESKDDEEIDMYLVNPKAPCFIRDEEGKYIYLILPVNFTTVS